MSAFCPNCGAENPGNFCASCGAPRATAQASNEMQKLAASNQVARMLAVHEMVRQEKQRHGIPALLSFFIPGLGQLVKGDILKGIGVFVGFGFSAFLMTVAIGWVTTPLIWLWQLYDAYTSN